MSQVQSETKAIWSNSALSCLGSVSTDSIRNGTLNLDEESSCYEKCMNIVTHSKAERKNIICSSKDLSVMVLPRFSAVSPS